MRIDGNIITLLSLQLDVAPRLISRIKILGKINISERRLPQDGRVSFSMGSQIIDVSISTLPTGSGERVVLRILGKQNQLIKIEKLDMPKTVLESLYPILEATWFISNWSYRFWQNNHSIRCTE